MATFKERVKSVSLIFACVFLDFLDLISSTEGVHYRCGTALFSDGVDEITNLAVKNH